MSHTKRILGLLVMAVLVAGLLVAGRRKQPVKDEYIKKALASLDQCEKYSAKTPYSRVIPFLALGYDKEGKPVQAAVIRSFKTYSRVTGLLVVRKDGRKYVVDKAEIVDIERIKDKKKRNKAEAAVKHILKQVVRDGKNRNKKLDVITGATRYANSIFAAFDLMAKAAVAEMEKNPKWQRKDLPVKAGDKKTGKDEMEDAGKDKPEKAKQH